MTTIQLRLLMAAALLAAGGLTLHGQTANTSPKAADPKAAAPGMPKPETKSAPAGTAPAPAASSGMTVFLDPATGQIRQPDASEISALVGDGSVNRSAALAAQPQTFRGPGNAIGMVLDRSMESFMVITKAPDGKLIESCVVGPGAAEASVKGAKAAPVKKEALDDK
jgi:hypothetical protein